MCLEELDHLLKLLLLSNCQIHKACLGHSDGHDNNYFCFVLAEHHEFTIPV